VFPETSLKTIRANCTQKTFDAEENTFQPSSFDLEKTKRIRELEDLVDQYRKELHTLSEELAGKEQSPLADESSSAKRPREEDPDERIGQLARKNRKLQDGVSARSSSQKLMTNSFTQNFQSFTNLRRSSRKSLKSTDLASLPSNYRPVLAFSSSAITPQRVKKASSSPPSPH
jgi:hypothetical protein